MNEKKCDSMEKQRLFMAKHVLFVFCSKQLGTTDYYAAPLALIWNACP